jgi:hypothetical protein
MPETDVVIYAEADGTAPLIAWLDSLETEARIRCVDRLTLLGQKG